MDLEGLFYIYKAMAFITLIFAMGIIVIWYIDVYRFEKKVEKQLKEDRRKARWNKLMTDGTLDIF